jgi:hypothetical protein
MQNADFEIAAFIWSSLIVPSTAFAVLLVGSFVFLGGTAAQAYSVLLSEAVDRKAEEIARRFDTPKEQKAAQKWVRILAELFAASHAWRHGSRVVIAVLSFYFWGVLLGILALAARLDLSWFLVASSLLVISLFMSMVYLAGIFFLVLQMFEKAKSLIPKKGTGR